MCCLRLQNSFSHFRFFTVLMAVATLAACSTAPYDKEARQASQPAEAYRPALMRKGTVAKPVIIPVSRPLQCVTHARELSGLSIRGDAWTWWDRAAGRYKRGASPKPGAVLVLSRTPQLRYGHIAVVTDVVSDREIVVEHANWLNRGQIHRHQIVRDVSARGDWSEVRVWYTPGQVLGKRSYAVSGFIYSPGKRFKDA